MECSTVVFSRHALAQVFARDLVVADVNAVLRHGHTIETYPDDKPYPSYLLLGQVRERILHVVAARDPATKCCVVVTAYEPSANVWESDSKTRRKK